MLGHFAAVVSAPAGARRVTAFMHGRTYVLPADVKEIFCDAARHRIARTVRAQAENVDAGRRSCTRSCGRCRSHDPRARDEASSATSRCDLEEDPQPAGRRVSEPAARLRVRLRRAPAVPPGRRRPADRLERDRAARRAVRAPHARRARDERHGRDGRVAVDGARHVELLEARSAHVHHRLDPLFRAGRFDQRRLSGLFAIAS